MKQTKKTSRPFNVNDPAVLKQFKRAAASLAGPQEQTKASATKTLVKLGILTEGGKVSSKYR